MVDGVLANGRARVMLERMRVTVRVLLIENKDWQTNWKANGVGVLQMFPPGICVVYDEV